eukprot:CAMPEP_0180760186 /NCGR_PEP_ID=MMETSP1038_2-20121128/36186_1 /TAXON_ID=632150 /ORGANISM="Azadinium spinosum, Strain 3D9" /LENGTH=321 /DNA_ID=CAMNT_0022794331 /DNA_START=128 /DNA_END=1093 /DNA_ORIENTATION=+
MAHGDLGSPAPRRKTLGAEAGAAVHIAAAMARLQLGLSPGGGVSSSPGARRGGGRRYPSGGGGSTHSSRALLMSPPSGEVTQGAPPKALPMRDCRKSSTRRTGPTGGEARRGEARRGDFCRRAGATPPAPLHAGSHTAASEPLLPAPADEGRRGRCGIALGAGALCDRTTSSAPLRNLVVGPEEGAAATAPGLLGHSPHSRADISTGAGRPAACPQRKSCDASAAFASSTSDGQRCPAHSPGPPLRPPLPAAEPHLEGICGGGLCSGPIASVTHGAQRRATPARASQRRPGAGARAATTPQVALSASVPPASGPPAGCEPR